MLSNAEVQSICRTIQHEYSVCDVSDALLKLKAPAAGFLPDIEPILRLNRSTRVVAPISTVLLVPTSEYKASESNIPPGKNWTDCSAPGTVVLAQQPRGNIAALLGDIMAKRLQVRGVLGAIVDGRIRDIASCIAICKEGEGNFQIWSKGVSAAGPTLEAKPSLVDVPLQIGDVYVKPGDILCADEGDMAVVVIPRGLLEQVVALLPTLKEASDGVIADIQNGLSLPDAVNRHPNFYSNYK
ncbi:DlpA domain protein [Xylogone sp. PMI_703]|nr:DlpA domain protein [Xylogone sp. PMI_703]